jgi:fructose-1,6-bisphosphatase II
VTTSTPDRIPGADRTSPPAGAAALALPLLRATQDAALAYLRWVGRDDEKAADGAAVAALRGSLSRLPGRVRVVIGEGEKDDAPMLYRGEVLGTGAGPVCDVVVDPLDGTRLCARGLDGAVSVIAAAAPGAMWATPGWYMDKLVVGSAAAGAVSLDRPVEDNLAALAGRLGKTVPGLVVGVQDRLGNQELVKALRRAGAGVTLFGDGDVTAALRVLLPGRGLDALFGIGGATEGVITACAARLLGGDMQCRLVPRSEERTALEETGVPFGSGGLGTVLRLADLVADADCVFVATGVTGGPLLSSPRREPTGVWTSSLLSTRDHPCLFADGYVPFWEE